MMLQIFKYIKKTKVYISDDRKENMFCAQISSVFFLLLFLLFLCLAPQSFASISLQIKGKVKSYDESVYKIQTNNAFITVKRSGLSRSLVKQLKMLGKPINVSIPTSAILSYKPLKTSLDKKQPRFKAKTNKKLSINRSKASITNDENKKE